MSPEPPSESPPNNPCELERAWAWLHRNASLVLLISGILTILLGWWGFWQEFARDGINGTIWDALYRAVQLLIIKSGSDFFTPVWQINIARFAGAVIFGASAIYILSILLREKIRQSLLMTRVFFAPLAHYFSLSTTNQPGHIVICGAGFLGSVLACHFRSHGRSVVVIEKAKDTPEIRTCRENGVMMLREDAASEDVLRRVGAQGAAMVFAVTGDDSKNTDIASACANLTLKRPRYLPPLLCNVHIDDANLSFALRQWEMALPTHDGVHVGIFNIYHSVGRSAAVSEARNAMIDAAEGPVPPVFVIIGLGDFGKSLLVNLAKEWFAARKDSSVMMRAVIVDRRADTQVERLHAIYPSLKECCDIVPQQMEIHSAEFNRGDFLEGTDVRQMTSAYVCLRNEGQATSVGITLHAVLCDQCGCTTSGPGTPRIIVRTVNDLGMTEVVHKLQKSMAWNLHAFPILTRFCEEKRYGNELAELLAEATHQDYREREFEKGVTVEENPSLVAWSELPDDVKDTNRAQAESLIRNIHEYGYRVIPMRRWDEPHLRFEENDPMIEKLAMKEHERYVAMKLAQGYRWGPIDDKNNKINHTLVPWDDPGLTTADKEKDRKTLLEFPDRLARIFFKLEYHPIPADPLVQGVQSIG